MHWQCRLISCTSLSGVTNLHAFTQAIPLCSVATSNISLPFVVRRQLQLPNHKLISKTQFISNPVTRPFSKKNRKFPTKLYCQVPSNSMESGTFYGELEPQRISYLRQDEAVLIDEELMGPLGFSIDQLMVLFMILENRHCTIP